MVKEEQAYTYYGGIGRKTYCKLVNSENFIRSGLEP
jgi:hypothetical protein